MHMQQATPTNFMHMQQATPTNFMHMLEATPTNLTSWNDQSQSGMVMHLFKRLGS